MATKARKNKYKSALKIIQAREYGNLTAEDAMSKMTAAEVEEMAKTIERALRKSLYAQKPIG